MQIVFLTRTKGVVDVTSYVIQKTTLLGGNINALIHPRRNVHQGFCKATDEKKNEEEARAADDQSAPTTESKFV